MVRLPPHSSAAAISSPRIRAALTEQDIERQVVAPPQTTSAGPITRHVRSVTILTRWRMVGLHTLTTLALADPRGPIIETRAGRALLSAQSAEETTFLAAHVQVVPVHDATATILAGKAAQPLSAIMPLLAMSTPMHNAITPLPGANIRTDNAIIPRLAMDLPAHGAITTRPGETIPTRHALTQVPGANSSRAIMNVLIPLNRASCRSRSIKSISLAYLMAGF